MNKQSFFQLSLTTVHTYTSALHFQYFDYSISEQFDYLLYPKMGGFKIVMFDFVMDLPAIGE